MFRGKLFSYLPTFMILHYMEFINEAFVTLHDVTFLQKKKYKIFLNVNGYLIVDNKYIGVSVYITSNEKMKTNSEMAKSVHRIIHIH